MAGIALPMLLSPGSWLDYNSAMATHSTLYRNDYDPAPPPQKYPAKIEGVPTDYPGQLCRDSLRRFFGSRPSAPARVRAVPGAARAARDRDPIRPLARLVARSGRWKNCCWGWSHGFSWPTFSFPPTAIITTMSLILNGVALGLVYTEEIRGGSGAASRRCRSAGPWSSSFPINRGSSICRLFSSPWGAILLLFLIELPLYCS